MIYTGLELGAFFEIPFSSACHEILRGVNPLLQMIFTFMQMYFIFMNARVSLISQSRTSFKCHDQHNASILTTSSSPTRQQQLNIHRFKVLARFGLMHIVATNVCVWIRTLVLEALKEITQYHYNRGVSTEDGIILGE